MSDAWFFKYFFPSVILFSFLKFFVDQAFKAQILKSQVLVMRFSLKRSNGFAFKFCIRCEVLGEGLGAYLLVIFVWLLGPQCYRSLSWKNTFPPLKCCCTFIKGPLGLFWGSPFFTGLCVCSIINTTFYFLFKNCFVYFYRLSIEMSNLNPHIFFSAGTEAMQQELGPSAFTSELNGALRLWP